MKRLVASAFAAAALCCLGDEIKPAIIKGTVVDAAGKSVQDAVLELDTFSGPLEMASDETTKPRVIPLTNGAFRAEVRGFARLAAWKDGLAMDWRSLYALEPGEQKEVKLVLGTASSLAGVVMDPTGKPAHGVEVIVSRAARETMDNNVRSMNQLSGSSLSQRLRTKTDAQGHFEIKGLPDNATVSLDVKASGLALKPEATPVQQYGNLPWSPGSSDIRLELERTGSVVGKVNIAGFGAAAPEITLRLVNASPIAWPQIPKQETKAALDGSFSFSDVPPAAYQVTSEFAGGSWVASPARVNVDSGEKATVENPIEPVRGGVAEVLVVYAKSGQPLTNTQVHAYSQTSQNGSGKTDSEGKARLRLIPETYTFVASVASSSSSSARAEVEEGKTNQVKIEIDEPEKAKGIVLTQDGKPAAHVSVSAIGLYGPRPSQQVTDAAGRFEIPISRNNFAGMDRTVTVAARDTTNNLAAATAMPEDGSEMVLKLEPGLTLAGSVECEKSPVSNPRVALVYWSGNRGMHLQGYDLPGQKPGTFEIRALPKGGRYAVSVSAPGYGSATQNAVAAEDNSDRIDLGALELAKATERIIGKVLDANEKPVRGASVSLSGQGQPSAQAQTDREGRFTFKEVCPGPARLFAHFGGTTGSISAEGGETNVVIRLGESGGGYVSGASAHKLQGTIALPDGKPASGAKAAVFPCDTPAWVTAKEDGSYTIRWAAQSWQLQNEDPVLVVQHADSTLAAAETFDQEATNLNVQLKPSWHLKGKVVNEQGKPLENAKINLQMLAGRSYTMIGKECASDADGTFEIKTVPPGPKYFVMANLKGYGRARTDLEAEQDSGEIQLEEFKLRLADKIVAGQVFEKENKPASGAHVQVLGDDQPQVYEQTGKDGRFKFNVCDGEVRVWANGNNSHGEAIVAAGDTNVVIQLQSYESQVRSTTPARTSLKGKPLPDCAACGLPAEALPKGKPALLCLLDAEQRPSRRAARLLAEQAPALQQKGMTVACIQAIPSEEASFTEWTNSAALPFALGRVKEKAQANNWVTEVKSLPWLILRDASGKVVDEGFPIEELEDRIKKLQ